VPIDRDQILAAAKAMTPAERYDLIEDLRQILDDDEFLPEQMDELQRRSDAADSAQGETIPVEAAIGELRDKLRKRRRRRAS